MGGRSFLASTGRRQNTLWIHDSHGYRQVTSEVFPMLFLGRHEAVLLGEGRFRHTRHRSG